MGQIHDWSGDTKADEKRKLAEAQKDDAKLAKYTAKGTEGKSQLDEQLSVHRSSFSTKDADRRSRTESGASALRQSGIPSANGDALSAIEGESTEDIPSGSEYDSGEQEDDPGPVPVGQAGDASDLDTGGPPPELYHYYWAGEPHNLAQLHDDGGMRELHKACDGQTSWSGYNLRHIDYADETSEKYGRVKISYKEAMKQYEQFTQTGDPWRNYMLREEDCVQGFRPFELDNGPVFEKVTDLTEMGFGLQGDKASCKVPSTASGARAVQTRTDLHLLEGPGKVAFSPRGEPRVSYSKHWHPQTGGIAPWRGVRYGMRPHVKGITIAEAQVAEGAWDGNREKWDKLRDDRKH